MFSGELVLRPIRNPFQSPKKLAGLGLAFAIFFLAAPVPRARAADAGHLKVALVSDTNSAVPGKPLWVGLHFNLDTGWHIYWINPGDSGEPPRVTWTLPEGFQAGPIEWPAPKRLGSGSVIDYGYDEPVLLPVEIRTPVNLKPGSRVALSANVRWLVCREICIPGKTDVSLTLPVRGASGADFSSSHELFQAARSRVPKPAPAAWKAQAVSEKGQFVLALQTGRAFEKGSFFPLDADQIDNSARQGVTTPLGGMRLTLKKSDQLVKAPALLRGVIELASGEAYEISAPVQSRP